MRRHNRQIGSILAAIILLAMGCSEQEASRIEKVSGKAWDKVQAMTSQVGAELGIDRSDIEQEWVKSDLRRRVQQRLQWDQQLRGSTIQVQIESEGVILTGTVKDDGQRQRALQLAESTDGVGKVRDALQIDAE